MARFLSQHSVARAVATFATLNLLMVLFFTLLVPSRPITMPMVMPLLDWGQVGQRFGLAVLAWGLMLYALRPGRRAWWEVLLLLGVGAGIVALLYVFYLPFLALGLIPVVARYWLPLWAVLGIVGSLVGVSGYWASQQALQLTFEVNATTGPGGYVAWMALPVSTMPNLETSFFIFIALLFAGYSLLGLELLIREARARLALEATRRELEDTSKQAGVLQERQRLAREIHDTLAQGFTSVVVHLEAAESSLPRSNPQGLYHLDQARASAREGLSEARRLVWALRPEILEGTPLPEALQRLLGRWKGESGIEIGFACTGEPTVLHPEIELSLLRVSQEALANIRKHARANKVTFTLSYLDDMVLLDVQDNGVGIQNKAEGLGGFGLHSMRERVEALGGSFTVESEAGEGTTLAVGLPLNPKPKDVASRRSQVAN
jgi:signal transduction histidine kinase